MEVQVGAAPLTSCEHVLYRGHRGSRLNARLQSVDASRIRDIFKEEIGKLPAKVESIAEGGGRQELSGQISERRLP